MKRSIDWQLTALKTDYIDFGFLHCIDEESDLKLAVESGVLDYIQSLKDQGTVRHIALGSHTPRLANKVLDMKVIDLLMFSINPGYDYRAAPLWTLAVRTTPWAAWTNTPLCTAAVRRNGLVSQS